MSADRARRAIESRLNGLGFSQAAINRIAEEDLPFLTTWDLQSSSRRVLARADAVISFAFGFGPARKGVQHPTGQYHPLLYEPGRTNEALADVIVPFAAKGLRVFAQWEIAEALRARGIHVPNRCVARPDKKYLGTGGVVEQFLSHGLGRCRAAILVAHRHHAFRCQQITAKVLSAKKVRVLVGEPLFSARTLRASWLTGAVPAPHRRRLPPCPPHPPTYAPLPIPDRVSDTPQTHRSTNMAQPHGAVRGHPSLCLSTVSETRRRDWGESSSESPSPVHGGRDSALEAR